MGAWGREARRPGRGWRRLRAQPRGGQEAFREFDLDKNGFVGAAEIAHVLQSMGEKATDDEVDEMILMADLDGDGRISFDEFFKLINSFQGMPPPQRVDGGRDGRRAAVYGDGWRAVPAPARQPRSGHGVLPEVPRDSTTRR